MAHRFDATLKSIVAEHPDDFAAVFGLPTDQPATPLNVDLSTMSAATDVALGFGDPIQQIVDLNFQSGPDADLPGRLLLYNAALHARFGVAVRSYLVLLRSKSDHSTLTGNLAYGEVGWRVQFEYSVIRLWREPVESFLHAGLAVLPLAMLCEMPADKPLPANLRETVRQIERRLGAETSPAEARRLMTATHILAGLRVKKSDLPSLFEGVRFMQETTAYDEWVEDLTRSHNEGRDQGRNEGLVEGRVVGRVEGCVDGEVRSLLRIGRRRFGNPDVESESLIHEIKDLDRLDRMLDAALVVSSWQELLATK